MGKRVINLRGKRDGQVVSFLLNYYYANKVACHTPTAHAFLFNFCMCDEIHVDGSAPVCTDAADRGDGARDERHCGKHQIGRKSCTQWLSPVRVKSTEKITGLPAIQPEEVWRRQREFTLRPLRLPVRTLLPIRSLDK